MRTSDGDLWVRSDLELTIGGEVTMSVRPECVMLSEGPPAGDPVNDWRGHVVNRAFLGDSADHVVGIGKIELRDRSNPVQSIVPGTDVYVTIDHGKIALVPAAT